MDLDPLEDDPLALGVKENDDEVCQYEDPLALPSIVLSDTNQNEGQMIFSLPVIKLEEHIINQPHQDNEDASDLINKASTTAETTLEIENNPMAAEAAEDSIQSCSAQTMDIVDIKPEIRSLSDNEECAGPTDFFDVLESQTTETEEGSLIVVSNIVSGADAVHEQVAADDSNEAESEETEMETFLDVKPLISLQNDWRLENRSHKRKLSFLLDTPGLHQDVVFIVGECKEKISAHSFILWMNSPIFEDIMKRKNAESNDNECSGTVEMMLEDVNVEVFRIVLKYMYTEEIGVTNENVYEVYKVAKKTFQIEELAQDCVEIMKKTISFDNVVRFFQLGQDFEETELYQQAYFFILQNGEMLLQGSEFLELKEDAMLDILGSDHLAASEITVFHAAMKWGSNKCSLQDQPVTPENIRKAMGQIIYKVRIPLLTAEEFKLHVVSSKILEPAEVIDLFNYFTPPFETVGSNFPFSTTPRLLQNEVEMETQNPTAATSISTCTSSAAEGETKDKEKKTRTRRKSLIHPSVMREIKDEEIRTRARKKSQIQAKHTVITVSSSGESEKDSKDSGSSSSSDEDAWAKSSEEQDSDSDSSDSDPSFEPPPRLLPKKRTMSMESNAVLTKKRTMSILLSKERTMSMESHALNVISKKQKIPGLVQVKCNPSQSKGNKLTDPHIGDICSYIGQLQLYPNKETVTTINGVFKIVAPPAQPQRVFLQNLNKIVLNLISPQLNSNNSSLNKKSWKSWNDFKSVAIPLFRSLDAILFVSKLGITQAPGQKPVDLFALDKVWASGLKVVITLNGVNILNLNEPTGDFTCCCIRNPALTNLVNGLRLRKSTLRRLTIAECDFRIFQTIPATQSLKCLRILKVGGLQGINEFLQKCPSLEELYWDGNGIGMSGVRTLNLDEDLNLFTFSCTLKKLVLSNVNVSLKDPNFLPRASVLPNPIFLFCEFSPKIMKDWEKIFPNVTEIQFRNYPQMQFFEKIVSMSSIQHIGVWGGRLLTRMKVEADLRFTTFLNETELRQHMRIGNIPSKIGTYASHSFFLRKHKLRHSTKVAGNQVVQIGGQTQWEVKEINKDPDSQMWDDGVVKNIYDCFQYSSICDFTYYRTMFQF